MNARRRGSNLALFAGSLGIALPLATLPMTTFAQTTPAAADTPLPTDARITRGTLPNGMGYMVMKHAVPPGKVALWLHVSSGSLNETDRQRGIAHFTEHMAFNGSKNFAPNTVITFFQELGLTFGRHQNASTSFDRTNYRLEMPNNDPATVEKGLLFLSDVAFNLSFEPHEIDEERGIILEEKRTRLGAQQRVQDQWFKQMAPGSILGDRLPIGVEDTIKSVTQKDFRDYYDHWYTPSNLTVMVVGDMDTQTMVDLVKKHFSQSTAKPKPVDNDIGVKPYTSSRAVVITDPELSSASLTIVRVDAPRPAATTEGLLRQSLTERLGSLALNRRIDRKISKGQMSFLRASFGAGNFANSFRAVQSRASGKPDQWPAMLKDLATELKRATLHGFTAQEIADASKEILSSAEQAVQTESTRTSVAILGSWDSSLSSGETITSASQELELCKKLLPAITPADVSKTFAAIADTSKVTFLLELPSSGDAPTEAMVLKAGQDALAVNPSADAEVARAASLLPKLPTPGTYTEPATHEASKVWSAWLDNGVRVHTLFNDYKKHEVTVSILLPGGEILESAANRGISDAAVLAWRRHATSTLASSDVNDLMVGKKVRVMGNSQPDALALSVSGSPDDLESGLQLAYLMLTDPKIEQAAFDQWKTGQLQAIEQLKFNPRGVLAKLMGQTIYGGDVRMMPLTAEQVNAISIDAAQAWLKKHITSSPIEVAVVGDIEPAKAQELVARYFGSLPKRERISASTFADRRTMTRPKGHRVNSGEVKTKTDQAQVIAGFYGTDLANTSDVRALTLASQIISTRMIMEVREKEQLVYSIPARSTPSTTYPGFGLFAAMAPTQPEKADRLAAKLDEMFTEFAASGPTEDELATAKKQIANTIDEQMKEPAFWLTPIRQLDYKGLKLDDVVNAPKAYQAMTVQQIKDVYSRYHNADSTFAVVIKPVAPDAGDAAPAPAKPAKN